MYNLVGSPILTNCVFENNSASRGGAVENTSSSAPVFKNVQFIKNSATGTSTVSGGGAMFSNGNSRPELSSVIFTENSSSTTGGAVSNIAGRLKMVNAVFSNNTATDYGGAYYSYYGTYDSISNTTFVNNSAQQGGAIYLLGLGKYQFGTLLCFQFYFLGQQGQFRFYCFTLRFSKRAILQVLWFLQPIPIEFK
jgi:predicted outer membrane repeat protein